MSHVEVRQLVRAPIEKVFERITDHESMRDWPGVNACVLIVEGMPRNGLGAVRHITAGGLTLDEEVVHYEPPVRYDYKIIKGLPIDHLGTVRLSVRGDQVEIDWRIDMESRVPLLAAGLAMVLRRGLPRSLRHFARSFH